MHESHHQEHSAKEQHIPEGEVIYRAVRQDGDHALTTSSGELAWSGLAAGISMGFSLVAEGMLRSRLPDTEWAPLLSKFGYSIGFLIVILGRQQLFTEQTLTAVLPLLSRDREAGTLANVARLWAVVLAANLLGTAAFAAVASGTSMFTPEMREAFSRIGNEAMAHGAWTTTLRAVPAGFLIAMMIWLLPGAAAARLWIVIFVTYVVGVAGFAHIVVGSAECLYVVFRGEQSFGAYVFGFLLPTFIGNSAGGVGLVAVLAHAQHAPEESK